MELQELGKSKSSRSHHAEYGHERKRKDFA